jgi:hypothetical protein
MSNFLRRVAANVIQPKTRLQPMLGSIFAPAILASPVEPFPAQGENSSQTFAPHHQELMTAPHVDLQALASQTFGSEEPLFPPNARQNSSADRPTRTRAADHPLLHVFSRANDLQGPAHLHPPLEASDLESSKSAAANQSPSPGPYQALIAGSQQIPPRLHPHESLPTSTASRTSASETARRSQPTQGEPDEIHIHIGRIEVAAIAQPAPRLAPAARRSLNLDEYLRRANGRPG